MNTIYNKAKKIVRPFSWLAICMAFVSLISLTTSPASAGIENLLVDRDILIQYTNTFEYFVATNMDWVKEDPENRLLSFVLSSNKGDQTVGYAEGSLYYQESISGWPEGLSGEGSQRLNKRVWDEIDVCPDAGYVCEDAVCLREENPFDPDNLDDVLISIFKNQKILLSINNSGVVFTPDYQDGILYGFSNGTLYTLSFSKEFAPDIPK